MDGRRNRYRFAGDNEVVADLFSEAGQSSPQVGKGLAGGAGFPEQVGQYLPVNSLAGVGQIYQQSQFLLAAILGDGLTVRLDGGFAQQGYFEHLFSTEEI